MEYREFRPHLSLRGHVRCFWLLRAGDAAAVDELVFPDGCTELIFHRRDRFATPAADGVFADQPRSLYHGQIERSIVLRPGRRVETIGIRFEPAGAGLLLGIPAAETTGKAIPYEAVARPFDRLEQQVLDAASWRAALRAIGCWLRDRADQAPPVDAAVAGALDAICADPGGVRIAGLACRAGISVRQLERKFAHRVGLSPKRLATIARLQRAFRLMEAGTETSLIEVAHATGYFDQSHFIHDFRRITGLRPGDFFRLDGEVGRLMISG